MKRKSMFTRAACIAVLLLPAIVSGGDRTDVFTVGCVNCGAFHYGNGRATPDEFKASWKKLASDWAQDVFFYEDVGKGVPGYVSQPNFDIQAAAKKKPVPHLTAK